MSYENKPKANWTLMKTFDNNFSVSISDKGCIKFSHETNILAMIPLKNVKDLGEVIVKLTHEDYTEFEARVAVTKEQVKIQKQVATSVLRAQQLARSALDTLVASGMSPEQAQNLINGIKVG